MFNEDQLSYIRAALRTHRRGLPSRYRDYVDGVILELTDLPKLFVQYNVQEEIIEGLHIEIKRLESMIRSQPDTSLRRKISELELKLRVSQEEVLSMQGVIVSAPPRTSPMLVLGVLRELEHRAVRAGDKPTAWAADAVIDRLRDNGYFG